ncbi:MAG: hypothetical protein OER56_02100 [Hyphomicrobiales bacterium]|nr:hypothetical protein [Hyphomicrobiales bacterium]
MSGSELPSKEIRKIIKKIAPDLQLLLDLLDQYDDDEHPDDVVEDSIRSGARSLLIARRIIKEAKG